jgi:hypothetical protein
MIGRPMIECWTRHLNARNWRNFAGFAPCAICAVAGFIATDESMVKRHPEGKRDEPERRKD